MTIFDSIKYPISFPPTEEQLEALPADLFDDWINNHTVDWGKPGNKDVVKRPSNVSTWMDAVIKVAGRSKSGTKHLVLEVEADVASLRKLILEYDNLR